MDGLKKNISGCLSLFLLALFFTSCQSAVKSYQASKTPESGKDIYRQAVQKAYLWVDSHPASFEEGGTLEILEEIIAFYLLRNHTEDISQKKVYISEIRERINLLASKKDFKVQPEEYTLLFTIASITEKLGMNTIDFRKIIEDQLISDPLLYSQHITSTIWITVYLERLGYHPPKGLEMLMSQSILQKEVSQRLLFRLVNEPLNPKYINPMTLTIYYLTHEIFSLTDFGELPPPLIITDNQAFFSALFDKTIEWAMAVKHIDLLAELIMCVKMLDLKDVPSLQQGIEFILLSQEDNGTFGITNPMRPNIYRHGILVSMMALSMA